MTHPRVLRRAVLVVLAAATTATATRAGAQSAAAEPAIAGRKRVPLDTAAILASARPDIEAANAAWLPGLRKRDAAMIAAPYADSALFIAADGTVTRGRRRWLGCTLHASRTSGPSVTAASCRTA